MSNTNASNGIIIWCNHLSIPSPISLSTNGMVQINPRTSGTAFTNLIDLTNLSILNTSASGLSIGNNNYFQLLKSFGKVSKKLIFIKNIRIPLVIFHKIW